MDIGEMSADTPDLKAAVQVTARKDLVLLTRGKGLTLTPDEAVDPDTVSRLWEMFAPEELKRLPPQDLAFVESLKTLGKPAQILVEVMLRSAALRLTKPPNGQRDSMYPDGTYRQHYPDYTRLLSLLPKAIGAPAGLDVVGLEQHVRTHVQMTGKVTGNPHPKMADAHPFTF